jgi:hypothetical protein
MEQIFTKLKTVAPSQEFKARSRMLVLSVAQNQPVELSIREISARIFRSSFTFAMSAAMLFLLAGGLSGINKKIISPAVLSALDAESLNKEMENFNIQIQIAQVKYYDSSAKKVEVALGETSGELKKQMDRDSQLRYLLNDLSL